MSSPKTCVIGPGLVPGAGLNQENQDGEEEPVITVAPPLRAFSTLPSVDSAVESWDGSNMDSSFTTSGLPFKLRLKPSHNNLHLNPPSLLVAPPFQSSPYSFHEWRNLKSTNNQSLSSGRQRANPLSDLGLSDDDWDRPPLGG